MAGLRSWSVPLSLFIISVSAYGGMVSMQYRHGNLGTTEVAEFLAWFGLAFAAYAGAVFWLERWWRDNGRAGSPSRSGIREFYLLAAIWEELASSGGCCCKLFPPFRLTSSAICGMAT